MGEARAVVLRDPREGAQLRRVRVDDPAPGEVRVRLVASGICGSDLHVLHGRSNAAHLPAVLGHEGAGRVEAVGRGVTSVRTGDRVLIAMLAPCGRCQPCLHGRGHLCESPARWRRIQGRMLDDTLRVHDDEAGDGGSDLHPFVGCGTLAELAVVPEEQLVPIPDEVPFEVAAICACGVLTGLGAAWNIARPEPGSSALVVGCGGVGLSVIQGCRLAGAGRIVAVDTNPDALGLAARLGATDVVETSATDPPAVMESAVREVLPQGADQAFEVVGDPQLLSHVFELTRAGGRCVATATYPPGSEIRIRPQTLFWDRRLVGCIAGNASPRRDLPRIFELYRTGRIVLEPLVGETIALENVDAALAAAERGGPARTIVRCGPPF